jgi:hypothetical protein
MAFRNRAFTALIGGLLGLVSLGSVCPAGQARTQASEGLSDGAGVWLNMWNYPADAEVYCLKLNASGVRNIFIQTSRSNTDAIANPPKLGELIDAAHRYKMKVIGWSFAELGNLNGDADKMIAAVRFRSPKGDRLDAIAADLEKEMAADKVEAYSRRIRDAVGESYPMVAVVYSPLNHAPQVAHIPWKTLDRYYNVIAPMNYWNSKYEKIEPYTYTVRTVRAVRQLVGRPDVEVHVIGDAMGTHADSINQFLAACKSSAATSASLYPNQQMTDEQLSCLQRYTEFFPVNSRFRLQALRELSRKGELVLGENVDPTDAIQRGDFYRLIVKKIVPVNSKTTRNKIAVNQAGESGSTKTAGKVVDVDSLRSRIESSDFGANEAFAILTQVGVVNPPQDLGDGYADFLAKPITTREALETAAKVMDTRDQIKKAIADASLSPPNRLLKNISKAGRLFVQPAYAEGSQKDTVDHSRTLNYLDAAQIVLQTSPGLR